MLMMINIKQVMKTNLRLLHLGVDVDGCCFSGLDSTSESILSFEILA